jgi:hypothetical protein
MTHIHSTHHHKKKWRPKAVEEKQTTTKIENKTTLVQHPAGTADSLASKAGQSAPGEDRPPLESGPSAPHQEASNDIPTSMEEDDLLGEDLVDYEASPERPGMDVNVITFPLIVLLSVTMNLLLPSLILVLKKLPLLNQRNR